MNLERARVAGLECALYGACPRCGRWHAAGSSALESGYCEGQLDGRPRKQGHDIVKVVELMIPDYSGRQVRLPYRGQMRLTKAPWSRPRRVTPVTVTVEGMRLLRDRPMVAWSTETYWHEAYAEDAVLLD